MGEYGMRLTESVRHARLSWARWSTASVNRKIFSATTTVLLFTMMVKAGALLKDLAVAHQFGTSDALDAYLIAFLLPSFAINVFAGAFSSAFIPTYVQERETNGETAAGALFAFSTRWAFVLLLGVTVLLALFGTTLLPLLSAGFDEGKRQLTVSLYWLLLPILVFNGMAMMWSAYLNAGERFALAAIAPILTPLAILFFLGVKGETWDIYALAIGTVAGAVATAGLLAWRVRHNIFLTRTSDIDISAPMRQMMRQYLPAMAGALLMSGTVLVDQGMAAMLAPGSVAALSYGNKLMVLFRSVLATALGTAVLPQFSIMVAKNDERGVIRSLRTYSIFILVGCIPLVLFVYVFSSNIISFIFERGAFTASDVVMVSQIQVLYIFQMPFYLIGIVLVRAISAYKMNYLLLYGAGINLGVNIIANYLFIQWIGVAGIALSTSIVYLVSTLFLAAMLYRRLKS